jgi:hypothetical protein
VRYSALRLSAFVLRVCPLATLLQEQQVPGNGIDKVKDSLSACHYCLSIGTQAAMANLNSKVNFTSGLGDFVSVVDSVLSSFQPPEVRMLRLAKKIAFSSSFASNVFGNGTQNDVKKKRFWVEGVLEARELWRLQLAGLDPMESLWLCTTMRNAGMESPF